MKRYIRLYLYLITYKHKFGTSIYFFTSDNPDFTFFSGPNGIKEGREGDIYNAGEDFKLVGNAVDLFDMGVTEIEEEEVLGLERFETAELFDIDDYLKNKI